MPLNERDNRLATVPTSKTVISMMTINAMATCQNWVVNPWGKYMRKLFAVLMQPLRQ